MHFRGLLAGTSVLRYYKLFTESVYFKLNIPFGPKKGVNTVCHYRPVCSLFKMALLDESYSRKK
jgi:hypothetical protein